MTEELRKAAEESAKKIMKEIAEDFKKNPLTVQEIITISDAQAGATNFLSGTIFGIIEVWEKRKKK